MSDVLRAWKLSTFHQMFALPEALVLYIEKNQLSPTLYHKLIRCCKYFWLKNPIITLNRLDRYSRYKHRKSCKMNGFQERQKFQIENLSAKLWIYKKMSVCEDQNQFMASTLIARIYRCDLTRLRLSNQSLTFDEFKKFTSSGSLKRLSFKKTYVKNLDGTIVPIEKLIELLPKLRRFDYGNVPGEDGRQTLTSETAAELVALPHFPKMKRFKIREIPETFDFEAFFTTPKVSNLNCFTIPCIFSYNFNFWLNLGFNGYSFILCLFHLRCL